MKKPSWMVIVAVLITLLSSAANPAHADGIKTLKYEETISGEITANVFEESYTFTGKKDDLVGIEMTYAHNGPLANAASFTVAAPDTNIMGKANWQTSGGKLRFLFLKLPVDGEYVIKAGREKPENAEQIGKFNLRLFQIRPLEFGDSIAGELTIDADGYVHEGYAVVMSVEAFRLEVTLGEVISSGGIDTELEVRSHSPADNATILKYSARGDYLSQSIVLRGSQNLFLVRLRIGNYVSMKDQPLPSRPFTITVSSVS
jgi:hypothetical protein